MGTSDGPLRLAEYDKMICAALLAAFGKRTTNSTMKLLGDISIQVNGSEHILDDVITYVGRLATVNHDLGDLEPDELQQVIEVLNTGLSKEAAALGRDMRTATEGKGYSVDQYCEIWWRRRRCEWRRPMHSLTGRRSRRATGRCLMQSACG